LVLRAGLLQNNWLGLDARRMTKSQIALANNKQNGVNCNVIPAVSAYLVYGRHSTRASLISTTEYASLPHCATLQR